jgi:tetratricopeptide (TPR) repeat protein
VLELTPNNTDALRLLGALYLQDRKAEQALPLLQIALQAQPRSPEILSNLGVAFREMARGEEAATHFRQALAINPTFVDALLNLGDVLRRKVTMNPRLIVTKKPLAKSQTRSMSCAIWAWRYGAWDAETMRTQNLDAPCRRNRTIQK